MSCSRVRRRSLAVVALWCLFTLTNPLLLSVCIVPTLLSLRALWCSSNPCDFFFFLLCLTGMAPELIRSRHYDYKADVWSLGIVGLELADYEPPHMAEAAMRAMFLIATQPSPGLKSPGAWSAEFRAFLAACLVVEPSGRAGVAQLARMPFLRRACSPDEFVAFLASLGLGVGGVFAGEAAAAAAAAAVATAAGAETAAETGDTAAAAAGGAEAGVVGEGASPPAPLPVPVQ